MGAFINPFTDWGFKHIFGKKEFLIEFLNDLLAGERLITDIRYLNNEREPEQIEYRKVIYDVYCETDTGEHIIVEMQNRCQKYFRDRSLYYLSKSVVQQAEVGKGWDFKLAAVYGVFFVNFRLDDDPGSHYFRDVMLIDRHTGKVFNDKFRQFFIELPRFIKTEHDCDNFLEYWIYNLVNMDKLEQISFKDKKAIFDRLEKVVLQANLSKEDRERYETEWKIYNDYFNTIETAEEKGYKDGHEKGHAQGLAEGRAEGHAEGRAEGHAEGHAEGRAEGLAEGVEEGRAKEKVETARNLKSLGVPSDIISRGTGLSIDEIEKL